MSDDDKPHCLSVDGRGACIGVTMYKNYPSSDIPIDCLVHQHPSIDLQDIQTSKLASKSYPISAENNSLKLCSYSTAMQISYRISSPAQIQHTAPPVHIHALEQCKSQCRDWNMSTASRRMQMKWSMNWPLLWHKMHQSSGYCSKIIQYPHHSSCQIVGMGLLYTHSALKVREPWSCRLCCKVSYNF